MPPLSNLDLRNDIILYGYYIEKNLTKWYNYYIVNILKNQASIDSESLFHRMPLSAIYGGSSSSVDQTTTRAPSN